MSFTYDTSTARGQVRLLARDTATDSALFADAEIDVFLDLSNDAVLLAAAMALDTIAANEVLVQKRIKLLGDLETDGPAEATALRLQATALRDQWAALSAEGAYFGWAEFADDSLQAHEHLLKTVLRGS